MKIRIGTRGSLLAKAQTLWVCRQLEAAVPGLQTECVIIKTLGDRILDVALDKIGDKGVFVKELEAALLGGEVDIAVHSLKDMPTELTPGLTYSGFPQREDPRDALVLAPGIKCFEELPLGAVIGTGSKRRKYQLLNLRPDLHIVDIRGNIETRMNKIESENLHGVVLAAAGLHRAGHQKRITQYLNPADFVPAPGQGALALQHRVEDTQTAEILAAVAHSGSFAAVVAERSFLEATNGGCHAPVGAYGEIQDGTLSLTGLFGTDDGAILIKKTVVGNAEEAVSLGKCLAAQIMDEIPDNAGKVWLVGAGPGDPGLMTISGKAAVQQAEVLVYDRLGTEEIMGWVAPQCECIYVGKESSNHTLTQDGINRLLVEKALQGKRVVRLKGGDPYVFGRGGEEALALRAAGVDFEEIPGITSAIAGLAYAGIPATHRGIATSFHVFTAHRKEDEGREDWPAIAALDGTLIFLMGRAALVEITTELIKNGKSPDTPAAIIQWGTTTRQRTVTGTLRDLNTLAENAGIGSPCLIVVGPVVTLRESLSFFESRPLFGKRGVVTRSRKQSSQLAGQLRAMGAQILEIPAIRIVPQERQALKEAVANICRYTWLVFTSVNGVEIFFDAFLDHYKDVRSLGAIKVAVIGEGTAAALKRFGIAADLVPEAFVAESLAEAMLKHVTSEDQILMPRAKEARLTLKDALEKRCAVHEIAIYRTEQETMGQAQKDELIQSPPDFITFASSSTVRHFIRMAGPEVLDALKGTKMYSIGPVTTGTMIESGLPVHGEARPHTIKALADIAMQGVKEMEKCVL